MVEMKENGLDQNKEYEWVLVKFDTKTINKRLTMVFDWSNKDADVIAREFLVIPNELAGSRIYNLMLTLGYQGKPDAQPDPRTFFRKGMEISAQPLKYYAEYNSEQWKWKLNEETIKSLNGNVVSLDEKELGRLKMLASRQNNYQEAMQKVASVNPIWMPAFLKLVESGELSWG